MNIHAINCANCRQPLPDDMLNRSMSRCRYCGKSVQLNVFPALFRENEQVDVNQLTAEEGESSCFYHEDKKAVTHCEACGRFVCELCHVDLNTKSLCPSCVQSSLKSNKIAELENRRPLHHRMALMFAIIGKPTFMLFIPSIVAVIYAVLAFRQKPPAYSQSRAGPLTAAVVAIVFALGQVLGGAYLWLHIYFSIQS